MGREGERGLPGRVAAPDDVNVASVQVPGFVARGAVVDALAGEAVEALDGQLPPGLGDLSPGGAQLKEIPSQYGQPDSHSNTDSDLFSHQF